MKKYFLFIASILFVLSLNSCSNFISNNSDTGLSVTLPSAQVKNRSNARAGETGLAEKWYDSVTKYEVYVEKRFSELESEELDENRESNFFQKEGKPGETITFTDIGSGTYSIIVIAYEEESPIGSGESEATVIDGKRTAVTIKISKYDDEEESDEILYGGSVTVTLSSSSSSKTFSSLSQALVYAGQNPAETGANTITLNGNVCANLLDYSAESSETVRPWFISNNLIIDLNHHVLCWSEFNSNELNTYENPLFQVANDATLLIKNGIITSESGFKHQNILIGTMSGTVSEDEVSSGTIALSNVTIKDVTAPFILYAKDSKYSGEGETTKGLYLDSVTISDCVSKKVALASGEFGGDTVSLEGSSFYALNTTISECLAEDYASVIIANSSDGAFVGGKISLTEDPSEILGSSYEKQYALVIAGLNANSGGSSLFVSSSTIFTNTTYYYEPVVVYAGYSQLNLADGFTFVKFDENDFVPVQLASDDSETIYADDASLGLTRSANIIAASKTSSIDKDSTETALQLGIYRLATDATGNSTEKVYVGSLYINGNSSIYGVVNLAYKSNIGQTGAFSSDTNETIKIDFGEYISNYENASSVNYPIYWAAGTENTEDESSCVTTSKFEVYNADGYSIQRTNNVVAGTDNALIDAINHIYAPLTTGE